MPPTINDLKVYIPARDFELSKRFYAALGFELVPAWGKTMDCCMNGQAFRLQDYYVEAWASNVMIVMGVDDARGWHALAESVVAQGGFGGAHVKPLEEVGDSLVVHVVDPSGVLLVFVA